MSARIVQVSVSRGGVPKTAVSAARVTVDGVEHDRHRNLELHGGADRAVCLFSMEAIMGHSAPRAIRSRRGQSVRT